MANDYAFGKTHKFRSMQSVNECFLSVGFPNDQLSYR